jgi:hypothetical protein
MKFFAAREDFSCSSLVTRHSSLVTCDEFGCGQRPRCVEALLGTEDTARQSRKGKFQIQNSRSELPEKFARKATNYDLVLQRREWQEEESSRRDK